MECLQVRAYLGHSHQIEVRHDLGDVVQRLQPPLAERRRVELSNVPRRQQQLMRRPARNLPSQFLKEYQDPFNGAPPRVRLERAELVVERTPNDCCPAVAPSSHGQYAAARVNMHGDRLRSWSSLLLPNQDAAVRHGELGN